MWQDRKQVTFKGGAKKKGQKKKNVFEFNYFMKFVYVPSK